MGPEKIYRPKKYWAKKNIFGQKKFGSKEILGQKNFGSWKNFAFNLTQALSLSEVWHLWP